MGKPLPSDRELLLAQDVARLECALSLLDPVSYFSLSDEKNAGAKMLSEARCKVRELRDRVLEIQKCEYAERLRS